MPDRNIYDLWFDGTPLVSDPNVLVDEGQVWENGAPLFPEIALAVDGAAALAATTGFAVIGGLVEVAVAALTVSTGFTAASTLTGGAGAALAATTGLSVVGGPVTAGASASLAVTAGFFLAPPLPPRGGILLDSLRFSTDPDPYEFLNWARRTSYHPTIGGGLVIQDFGVRARDDRLRLGSGEHQFLSEALVEALHARYRTQGATYLFSDWLGNTFTVQIMDFRPVAYRLGLYRYTLELRVVSILQLFGAGFS